MRPELLDDATTLAALFLLQGSRPAGPSGGPSQVLRDLEVVEAAQPTLKRAEGRQSGQWRQGSERGREVGEVSPVPHADSKAVQPSRGGLSLGSAVRLLDLASSLVANLREVPIQILNPVPWGVHVKSGADPFEESGVPFGP
jgi:hypothetical protein